MLFIDDYIHVARTRHVGYSYYRLLTRNLMIWWRECIIRFAVKIFPERSTYLHGTLDIMNHNYRELILNPIHILLS